MIPELGHYAIILACCLAGIQATLPLLGAYKQNVALMRLSRRTAYTQCLLVTIAFLALAYSLLSYDFSVVYVAQNSNTQLPWMYRLSAVWGAHEGSLLLWVLILTGWMVAVSRFSAALPLDMLARVLAILSLIAIGFYVFLLSTSDPFLRYLPEQPLDGNNLNPILQDPGLATHPPILYMGYVGLSVPFALSIAALLRGQLLPAWAHWMRRWTLIAWCFLTVGIVLGSWWAYRELGWGGFWFWDPVENASFMPWLAATALIHVLIVAEKRQVFKSWTLLLAIAAFSLSLLGTFLVRSGILISVHAFASDPKRGLYLLEFLALVVGLSLALYAWRGHRLLSTGRFHWMSREMAILSNNLLLFIAMTTILMGTLYPLIVDVLHLEKLSVGAPYFNTVFFPLMWPLLCLMGMAPHLSWHWTKKPIWRSIWPALALSLLLALLLAMGMHSSTPWTLAIGVFFSFWVLLNTLSSTRLRWPNRSHWAMDIAHLGVGILVLGLLFASLCSQSRSVNMAVGDQVELAGYRFQLDQVSQVQGPNYIAEEARVTISKAGQTLDTLHPQLRTYPDAQQTTPPTATTLSKTAINVGIFRDLYVALGSPLPDHTWAFRIYYKPMVRWIWWGGLLAALGGALAAWQTRKRGQSKQPESKRLC